MTSRASAMRYARALFDVASKEGADLNALERDLSAFASLVAGHEGLGRVLANPAIPAVRKRGVVEQLLARAQVSPILVIAPPMIEASTRVSRCTSSDRRPVASASRA